MTSTGDIIAKAVEELDEHGWTTGTNIDRQGRMCALGAVCKALWGHAQPGFADKYKLDQMRPVLATLAAHVPSDFVTRRFWDDFTTYQSKVVNYNNTRGSYAEVREWFEKAALNEGISLCHERGTPGLSAE